MNKNFGFLYLEHPLSLHLQLIRITILKSSQESLAVTET